MAGDLTGVDVQALAERTFGGWQAPGQRRAPQQTAEPGGRTAVLVDRPGAVQADLRLGAYAVDRTDPSSG